MITFTEKEDRILNLIDETLSNYDSQKTREANKILDEMSIQNEAKIDMLSKEIFKIQQFNTLFNLDLIAKVHQTIIDSSNKNKIYDSVISIVIDRFIKPWCEASQFLQLLNNDLPISVQEILENMNQLLSLLSNDIIQIDESLDRVVFNSLVEQAKKVNEQKSVDFPEDLENNASMNPKDTGMKFYVSFLKTLFEGKSKLKELLDNLLKDTHKDNEYEKTLLNLYYFIVPNKTFSDRYIVYKKKKFEKGIPKPRSQQDSKEFLDFIDISFKTLKREFIEDCSNFIFEEKFGREHILELTRLVYITKIESITNELSGQFSESFCHCFLKELYQLLESFTYTFTSELDPSESDSNYFKKILGGMARNVSKHILSSCYLNIESDVRKYFETITGALREMTIAKENIDAEAKEVGKNSLLFNIDMSTKANNYIAEYGLIPEKENQPVVFHKQFDTFGKDPISQEEIPSLNTAIIQPLFPELDQIKSPGREKLNESPKKKDKYTSSSMSSIYSVELLDYSAGDSVNLNKEIKYAKWVEAYYNEYPFQTAIFESDIRLFEKFLPVRISMAVLNLLNKIDPMMEGLIKVLSYFDLSDSYIDELKKKISSIIDSTEYHVFEYLNEVHSSSLLLTCDWIFLNFTFFNYLNCLFCWNSTPNKNHLEFFKSFIQSFLENANKIAAFQQKNYINEIFLIALPSIDNQDWSSFRPFASSEIKEENLKIILNQISNTSNIDTPGKYVKNINYGLRMWKNQIQKIGSEIQNLLSDGFMQIIGLKLYLDTVVESLSSIYIRYKCIHPSRIRNPQLINDLKFLVNEAYEYSIIVFGLMLIYFENDGTTVLTSEKIYLCSSFLSVWKISRLLRIQLAIMELDHNSLATFLKDCIDEKIKLPKYSEEEFNQILEVAENMKTIKIDQFTFAEKEKDLDTADAIQETKRIKPQNSAVLEDGKNQISMINEFVNKFQRLKGISSLESMYESFELILESSKTDLEKGDDKSIYISMNTLNKNKSDKSPSGSQANITPFVSIKEDIQSRLKVPVNPLLKHANNVFLKHSKLFEDKSIKSFLKNPNLSPQHILFILKKRIEYTTDQYPQLTDENKKAQKTLNPLLRDLCSKYEINMITVPAE